MYSYKAKPWPTVTVSVTYAEISFIATSSRCALRTWGLGTSQNGVVTGMQIEYVVYRFRSNWQGITSSNGRIPYSLRSADQRSMIRFASNQVGSADSHVRREIVMRSKLWLNRESRRTRIAESITYCTQFENILDSNITLYMHVSNVYYATKWDANDVHT